MVQALLVFLGGGLGSVSRYAVGLGLARWAEPAGHADTLPTVNLKATLLVNVLGCLLIGLAWGWAGATMRPEARAAFVVWFLGEFTTFSTVGWETFALIEGGQAATAAASVLATIGLGITAVWLGHAAGVRLGTP